MLAIRLTRLGAKKRPFYRVVVAEKRSKRDGRFIENVGYYNPIAQGQQLDLVLKLDRIDYWIQHGAQPTDTVRSLIKRKKAMDRKNPPAASL